MSIDKLIRLHPADNILIVRQPLHPGETTAYEALQYEIREEIPTGHKMAGRDIAPGEKIIKSGVPIGSATRQIQAGEHIHLHNMKSDYLPTYTLDQVFTRS